MLGRLDKTIMQAAKQKQGEAAAMSKATSAANAAEDAANKVRKEVRSLKKKLSSSSETLGNVHVKAQAHAAKAQRMKAANLKMQQEAARVKASQKLAAHDTAVFEEEAARDAISTKKQQTLAAALKLQQNTLAKQLKSLEAAHTVYKETSTLAESDATLSRVRAAAQTAAKNVAVKLINRKAKALNTKTKHLNRQTLKLSAEVAKHETAKKAKQTKATPAKKTEKKQAEPAGKKGGNNKPKMVELIQEDEGRHERNTLGEAVNAQTTKGIRKVMKHCRFSMQKKTKVTMWFVGKHKKDGSRNYDNTSMLCGCVRACHDGAACARNCLWERGLRSRFYAARAA
jgi:hypothetical protein